MAQVPPGNHFYLSHKSSYSLLKALWRKGPNYTKEDICNHAWQDILRVYFPAEYNPNQLATGRATMYHVLVQAYRGLPADENHLKKPDAVTVQVDHVVQAGALGGYDEFKRDVLWVECKAPSKDKPGEWNVVMREAVARLHVAHNTRRLYIILNVGLEWLPFYWDPINPGNALTIKASAGHQDFPVDPRIRPTPNFPTGHIGANGVIHTNLAKTLDCFTTTTTPQGTFLAYQNDLNDLEAFLQVVMTHNGYNGLNDPSFEQF
ncbi:hypothetical protein KVR01_000135 [Diaporthe batatas]|uniref:uncharacterized protein n=1 Tax=Diaporthe batatas TaxID=748121 RepID=UPI001D03ACC6|nr:uncharacterized protein KVR01_000135 [Diaporthe batatas]KAG8169390.1 hypothetical protein KVR01_000135 [Diaporthe batatas]